MSRSDSRQAPPGGYRPQSAHLQGEYDLSGWTQGLGGAPLPNPKPHQPAGTQAVQPQNPHAPQQAPQGYGYAADGQYWGQQAAPQFDPYVPPTQPSHRPAHQAPAHAYQAAPAQQQPYQPQQPAGYQGGYDGYQADPAPNLRGAQYDQWAAAPSPVSQPPAADPRGFDLASYMPPQGRAHAPQHQAPQPQPDYGHLTADLSTHQQPGYSDWGHQAGGYPAQNGYAAQPGYDANGYAQHGYDQQGYADPQAGYEDDYEQADEPRSRKWMTVAAALVGAIVVGGGLTYAYQSLLGGSPDGPTPVVKSAEGPAKVKPTDPGGKQFANTDSKLLGRLGDNGSGASASGSDTDAGSRKVQTLVVGRDGAIQAPSAPPEPVAVPGVSVPVPGMTLIDVPSPGAPPAAAPAAKPIVVQPPSEPVQVAAAEPVVPKAINMPEAAPVEPPAPVAEKPKPITKTAAIPAQPKPAAAAPPPVTKTTGLGYVAVLVSVPASGTSRIAALQQFADLQQRYGGILQNKTPDVTEANLGEKGRYHRLVVGPPGSKDGANAVCSQLKTAGYDGCWVTAY